MFKLGAKYLPSIQNHLQVHRFIVPVFIHINVWHLIVNMLALLMLGNSTEHFFGVINYAILLLLSGFGGNLFSAALASK